MSQQFSSAPFHLLNAFGRGFRNEAPKHFAAGRYLGFSVGYLFSQSGPEFLQFPRLTSRVRGGIGFGSSPKGCNPSPSLVEGILK